ncbi:hypothetical protein SRHO_G00140060 [Serrasalmus rhombeus]
MVISKETRAVIIALHKNGLTGKSIAARKIAPQSTIYRIIKNFKERGSIVAKKAPGRPRKTSKCQDRLLKVFQLRDRATSSAELAQEWQQAGVSASARTVRRRLLEQGLVSRRAEKKPLLSRKNIRDRLIFCKRYREWTAEDWGKVIFSDESPFRLFGTSGKQLVRRRRGERYHQSCLMPTVKHPETIHVWGCFSAKGIGSLAVLPKNTAMNKEWYQNVLREQLLPTVQEQFGDQQCLFQHDGAPCHKAKVNAEFLRVTTKPLRSKFLSQFDNFTAKLMQILQSKGGVKGQRIKRFLEMADSCSDIDLRRECVLRSLVVYLNEDPDAFFTEYEVSVFQFFIV